MRPHPLLILGNQGRVPPTPITAVVIGRTVIPARKPATRPGEPSLSCNLSRHCASVHVDATYGIVTTEKEAKTMKSCSADKSLSKED